MWFDKWIKLLLIAAVVTGLYFRVSELDLRPLHHDESIHATFAHKWFLDARNQHYVYDPTYHGPLLYVFNLVFFDLFGVGVKAARATPLFFNLLTLLAPLGFAYFWGWPAALCSVFFIALSPLMVFYAQFHAHDMPVLAFGMFALLCIVFAQIKREDKEKVRTAMFWFGAGAAFGCLCAVKLISHIWLFTMLTYLLFWKIYQYRVGELEKKFDYRKIFSKANLQIAGLIVVGFLLAFATFQTSLWLNPKGFLDGLYRSSIPHWWEMHKIERLKGPVYFHLRAMMLEELFPSIIVAIYLFGKLAKTKVGRVALTVLVVFGFLSIPHPWNIDAYVPSFVIPLFAAAKVTLSADLFVYVLCFVFGILGMLTLWREKKLWMAFFCYWAFASLAIFSYIGEKGPWLTVHISYPLAIFAGLIFAEWLTKLKPIANSKKSWQVALICMAVTLAAVYQTRISYIIMRKTMGKPQELLSQVHNHQDVIEIMNWMKQVARERGTTVEKLPIAVVGKPVWAFYFYMLVDNFGNYRLDVNGLENTRVFYILGGDEHKQVGAQLISMGYKLKEMHNEGWWVPEYGRNEWRDWLWYAWMHEPPLNSTGGTQMYVYYKL